MVITHHGGECFKIAFGDTTLAFNPISKESKTLKPAKFGADIAFITTRHPDMNGVASATHGGREPFIVDGPGEYEIAGVLAHGVLTHSRHGGAERLNTVYRVSLEGMNILFLGALAEPQLPKDAPEMSENIDVLFVPVGGEGVLDASAAQKLAVEIGARIVIPMHFSDIGEKDALTRFLKEAGAEGVTPVEKLTLKKKDLDGREGDIVVLSS